MDLPAVLAQLNDLPDTFKRKDAWYTQFVDAVATGASQYTLGIDEVFNQVTAFNNALGGWLDTWGLLFGVPRLENEADSLYEARIGNTVLAWVGTIPAIQTWINLYAPGGTVTENIGTAGYTINMPPSMTALQTQQFLQSLARIRPAGVPFNVQQTGSGLFLGTEEFLGDGRAVGNYLTAGTSTTVLTLGATTLSAQPILPGCWLTDPTLNPSLAPAG